MSDTAKLSEDFVYFSNESEKNLHELRRDWIDQLATPIGLETRDSVKATLAPEVPKIESIFIPEDTPVEKIQEQIAESVRTWVCSRAMAGQSLAFFIVGVNGGIEIYLADDNAKTELLQGSFPGISFGAKKNPCNEAKSFKCSSLITGVPTTIHKDTVLTYSCDQLLRGMRGRRFMLALVAKPVPKSNIQALLQQTRQAIDENHALIKRRLSEAVGESTANTIGASVGFSAGIFAAFISTITISSNLSVAISAAPMGVGVTTTVGGGIASTLGATIGAHLSGNVSVNASKTKGRNTTKSSDEEKNNQFAQAYESKLYENENRLTTSLSEGLWQVATYLFADTPDDLETCSSIYLASLTSRFDPQEVFRALPISTATKVKFGIPRFSGQQKDSQDAHTLLTTSELASMIALPVEDHPGIIVKRVPKYSVNPIRSSVKSDIVLGSFCDRNVAIQNNVFFSPTDMTGHTLVAGITGSGKSTTIRTILSQINVPFLVFEPAKSEYRNLKISGESIRVITAGDENVAPLRINPFEIAEGDTLHSNIDALSATINAAFPMEGPMAALVEQGLIQAYKDAGWDTSTGAAPDDFRVPTMNEFYAALEKTIDVQKFEGEYGSNIKSALLTRINSLRIGPRGRLFNSEVPFDVEDLLAQPTVIEMKKIGSDETKAFLTGILLYRVYRYFENLGQKGSSSSLKSVLVIEEAHRLFRKTSENSGSITGNNTKHHSVEMFENIMAEVRSYGLGLIIADQLPLRLSDGAVKNTNIKIIHRLAAREDAIDMGGGMGLDEKQSAFINILPRGEALTISPNLLEAAHVKITAQDSVIEAAQMRDADIRDKWATNISIVRPAHFDTFVEQVKKKDPECLNIAGNNFFTNLQLCSIKRINEFWSDATWGMYKTVHDLGLCNANTPEAKLLATHLLHYAVANTIRSKKYLLVQQRQKLIIGWDRCLDFNANSKEYALNINTVLEVKEQLDSFAQSNVSGIPQWISSVISNNKIIQVYAEAELFAETIFKSREKDLSTMIRRDIASASSTVAQAVKRLSSEIKIEGERYVDFAFVVMLHLLNKIRPKDYEKPIFQSQIYGTLTKILGAKR